MSLSALGIVFGDIGTSPLYTLKTVLAYNASPDPAVVLGALSLIIWTLIIITTIKYVTIAMSIDNDGEGGILALMSLIGIRKKNRPLIVAAGLFGAALIYGDGAITPSISVLSAVEGLNMVTPAVQPYVLPAAIAIILMVFLVQPLGTQRIGKAFGPVMAVWFLALAATGIAGILQHPAVFAALSPVYGLQFLATGGMKGFLILGAVFLCVTGAEALYADMGHFGAKPIRLSWLAVVFPSLILNYAGQAAILLEGAPVKDNIFFQLSPSGLLIPMVFLATLATIIASQAVITGAYSMTRQAIQLGWLPRLTVKQTSKEGYGQIYVGSVNWILMFVTLGITLAFKKSDNLASAYGIAVSLTMFMTTLLLYRAMREVWNWPIWTAGPLSAALLIVDAAFVSANSIKIAEGGYVPLLIAVFVYLIMWIWHRGAAAVTAQFELDQIAYEKFQADLVSAKIPRVPGSAVFLTRSSIDIPPVLAWHIKHNRALHHQIMVLTVRTAPVPRVPTNARLSVRPLGPGFWRGEAVFGFMDRQDIPALLETSGIHGCSIDLADLTYYVGHVSVIAREDGKGLPRWIAAIYALLESNSSHVGDVLRLPRDCTVEIGRQIEI